jgi:hypothetical protein
VLWAVNPFTAIVLAPTLHLWLLAAAPEVRSRVAGLALAAAGALPLVAVALFYAARFAVGPVELAWLGVLGLTGGGAGPLGVLATAALLGCGTAAVVIAARKRVDGPDAAPTAGRRSGLAPAGRPYAVLEPAAPR